MAFGGLGSFTGAPVILGSKREDSGLEDRKEFTNSTKIIGMISRGQSTGKVADTLTMTYEGPIEKAMAPHSSTLAWKIPWTEEPGGPQSMGLLRVRHD